MKPRDLHHKLNHHRKAGAHGRGRRDPQGKREAVEEHLEGENEETLTAGPTERDRSDRTTKTGA